MANTASVATVDPILSQSLDLVRPDESVLVDSHESYLRLDQGFLDNFDPMSMPELNEEMVPVDSFFNSYVESLELGAREGQGYAGQIARMDTGDAGVLPPALSLPFPAVPSTPLSSHPPGSTAAPADGTSAFSNGVMNGGVPQTMPMPEMGALPGPLQALPASGQMPSIPTTSATDASSRGGRKARSGVARATAAAASDDALHQLDHEKTKRNPKQQLQNKQAQQRYRERRKLRFQELEEALNGLSEQMQAKQYEVAGLQNQNAVLQGKAQELTQAMAARDKELAVLRAQLAGGASATAPGPASSDGHSSGTQHGEEHEAQGSAPRVLPRSKLSDAELAACRVQYDALVSAMRELATRHSLNVANVLGEGVAPGVLEQVRELVQSGCRASQDLERKGGIQVLEVMGRDVEKLGGHSCATERARWGRILEALRLVPRQEEALLALRKQHLSKLHQIYHQRQSLNMQAMGMMLPTAARGDVASQMAGSDPTLEGKMACMSIGSYADCARNTMQLDRTLDELKDNLRAEQTSFLELKLVVLHRVLSPIQTLMFVTEAYPTRPDALALANSVALKLGRAAEGCPRAAELLKAASAQEEAFRRKSSAATSSGELRGSGGSSLEGTDDSHKSDCCSLNQRGDP